MGLDVINYLVIGYVMPEPDGLYDNDDLVAMIDGRKGQDFSIIRQGDNIIFGVVLDRNSEQYDDEVREVKPIDDGIYQAVHQKRNELFGKGLTFDQASERPKMYHFNHVW